MKIICVEEHTVDRGLQKAGQGAQQAEAPYMTEVGTCFKGRIEDGDEARPLPIDFQTSGKLGADTGAGRIAEMDRHHIDMQVLSYSNPPSGYADG